MNLQQRIDILSKLKEYILSDDPAWQQTKKKAGAENSWFIPEFVELAARNIAENFLEKDILERWVTNYKLAAINNNPKVVGIVMAGNIPLVGFHDLLCVFISGHKAFVKPSSKDETLIKHLVEKMIEWTGKDKNFSNVIQFADMLKNCDAYIATGSTNSAGYFEYYFNKYPHIIRRNRTSVAILTGSETKDELEKLADDVCLYFGLGCRNVTKIYVPENYDFIPLLKAFEKYDHLVEYHKYKNNYDYNLAIQLMNKRFYMSNASILLTQDVSIFSPIGQLHYEFYTDIDKLRAFLENNNDVQCIVGKGFVAFGQTQCPSVSDYADGADTLFFLTNL